MYNLLMCALEGTWDSGRWALESDRFLEYTHEAIAGKFRALDDPAIAQLKSLPALFTYEQAIEPARVGRITDIQRGSRELKIAFELDPAIPPLQRTALIGLYADLDIDRKLEVRRTHWAIKEVDLPRVLRSAGLMATEPPLRPLPRTPKVFISYSWDSAEHNQWVAQLGGYLRQRGVDVILDTWYLRGGDDLAMFMERSVRDADRVLVICTENYVDKTTQRHGGVGYEHLMVTAELMQNMGTHKFIPIVRQTRSPPALPANLRSRLYFNLSDGPDYAEQREALVRELLDVRIPIPPLGKNPYV